MSESWRSLFVRRSVFGRFGPQIAENSPANENAPTKTGHSGPDSMIPETFRRRCRKRSAIVLQLVPPSLLLGAGGWELRAGVGAAGWLGGSVRLGPCGRRGLLVRGGRPGRSC